LATYRTAPDPNETGMPGGIPYIVGNEAAERFSFYGMKAILTVFLTEHLLGINGQPDFLSPESAKASLAWFTAAAYVTPFIGAIISDRWLGKYRTILYLSLFYCVGTAFSRQSTRRSQRPWRHAGLCSRAWCSSRWAPAA
jgi:POT family proton-dependent oligopeptide transporter